jgi:hypothetical protein
MKSPKPNEVYRHYKGNEYRVLMLATHTETGEELVIYQALYGENKVWARPTSMFTNDVTVNGETLPRFSVVEAIAKS